jgi:N6-adenosine-specific RNA methylase IME4/predicted transcriptional regulator
MQTELMIPDENMPTDFVESPNTVHGRLMESVHLSGYTMARACKELEWLLDDDRWQKIGKGFDHVNDFLKTIDLSEFKISIERRKSLASKLQKLQASQRATARTLGVDQATIHYDLKSDENSSPPKAIPLPIQREIDDSDENSSPPPSIIRQSGVEAAQAAERAAQKEEKLEERKTRYDDLTMNVCSIMDLHELITKGIKFRTIYADPPWKYSNQGTRASTDNHYKTMTIDEMLALPIEKLAEDNAHLHLWTTNAFIFECHKILKAWGFEYKSIFVWVKPQMGIGNYWRMSHEFMILGVRGSLTFQNKNHKSWIELKRGEHSAKPDEIRKIIEEVSPSPRLELFGRKEIPNWVVWGNQIQQGLFLEQLNECIRSSK